MAQWEAIVLCIGVFVASGTDALDAPSDISIFGVSLNSFFVNFTRSPDAVSCEIKAQAKFQFTDTQKVNFTDTEIKVSGLQSNVRYVVTVRCFTSNGTESAYTTPIEARTYPNGSNVVASRPFPHIFTVFLEPIPGAKQWILEVLNAIATAPTINILESPYKIFNDAIPDTMYTLRARISRIKSKDLTEAESPYGEPISITTAKLSVFGRVTLSTQLYDSDLANKSSVMFATTSTKWEDALLKEYSGSQPKTARVNILEFENSSSIETIAHHEIFVSGTSLPDVSSFVLNSGSLAHDGLKVTADVSPAYQYSLYLDEANWELSFEPEGSECDVSDHRNFSLNRYDGWTQFEDFTSEEGGVESVSDITLNDHELTAGRQLTVQLQSNSMYSIDQSYMFKICETTDDTSFLYSRRHGAYSPFTTPGYNGTVIHSTGPDKVQTNGITYRVSENLSEITISVPPIYRAYKYNFSIDGIQTIPLSDLDSSSVVEAKFSGISPLQEYCIMISVTINHADWRQQTSDPSCFPFYSGSPNSTSCRVVEVTAEKFRVTFEKVKFSTSYIVEITNATYARNYTTETNGYIADHLIPRAIYNVRVATQNPFGIGMFSETKTTKFWTFSDITNGSFKLAWDNETADLYYDVGIAQENRIIRVNVNEVVITGLEAGATYDANVTAMTDNGTLFLFTDQQITVPAKPSLRLQSKTAHSLLVAWDNTTGVDYYWANITGREVDRSFMNHSTATLIFFTDLLSGARYSIRVSFHNAGGSSETIADFVTDFQIPSGIGMISVTNNSISLGWNEVKGASSFLVSVRALSDDSSSFNVSRTTATVNLIDLSPGTNYSITIVAEYDEGDSEPSETFYQVTVPATPTNLTLLSNSKGSLNISWAPVYGADMYTVIVEGYGMIQNTSHTSSVVEKLLPNSGYNVEIVAHNSGGTSAGIVKRFFTEFSVPGNVTVSEIKSDSFLLKWTGNEDALRFKIFLRTAINSTVIIETNTTISNITSLKPYTNYSVSVRAIYAEGQSDSSEMANIVTVIAAPTKLTVTSTASDAFKIDWDAISGANLYFVTVTGQDEISTTLTNVSFFNVESGTKYLIRVRGYNDVGFGNYAQIDFETVPAKPSLRLQSKNAHSLLVAWDSTAGVDYYWANITGREVDRSFMNHSTATLISFTDLLSGARYSIRVSFHNAGGSSETIADFVTDFQIPSGIGMISATNDSISLGWNEVKGASSFLVTVRALSDGSSSFNVSRTTATVNLIDLAPGTNYSITVVAKYDEGDSEPSEIFHQVTVPATPTNLILLSNSKGSLNISWAPVYGADMYTVIVEGYGMIQNTSHTSSVVEKLLPNSGYNVEIVAHNSGGTSAGIVKRFFTEFSVPGNVTVSEIKSDSFLLKWTGNEDALRFKIFLRTAINSTVIIETNGTISNITSLKPYTNYSVSLRAIYAEGQSDSSEMVNIVTVIAAPTKLTVTSTASDPFKVEWNAVSGANLYFVTVTGQDEINTTLTNVSFFNVESGTKYLIRVRGYNDAGYGSYAQIDFETVPSPPKVIVIYNNETSVTLSWNATKGAQEYFVVVTTPSGDVLGLNGTGITFETSITISGLKPTVDYEIKVSARSPAGNSTFSRSIELKAAPMAPSNMTLVSRTSVALQIAWNAVADVTAYDVSVDEYAATVTRNFAQIPGLKGGTIYTVTVRSVSSSGRKSSSVTADFQTLPNSPLITVFNSLQTSLAVKWDPEKGAEGYNVWIILQSTGSVLKNITTNLNETSFTDLTPGTKYTVNATSTMEGEHSSPPSTAGVITLCHPPSGVVVTLVTQNSVSMRWNPSQGADSYGIVVTSNSRRKRSAEYDPKVTINSTTGTVKNLSAGSSYSLEVAAVNSAGRSTSGTIAVKTGISNPTELLLVDVATTSVTLRWNEQSGATNYRLITTKADQQTEFSKLVGLVNSATVESLSPGYSYQFSIRTLSKTQPGSRNFENKDFVPSVAVITVPLPPSDLKVSRSGDQLLATWKMSDGAALFFVYIETESVSRTLNTTDLNVTVPLESHKRFTFTVTAMNAQNRMSAMSGPVHFSVDNNTTGGRTEIPWWIFVVVSIVILTIIVLLIIWWQLRKTPEASRGYYNVQSPDRNANDGEVATDYVYMEDLDHGGHLGPQESEPADERQHEGEIEDQPEEGHTEEIQQQQTSHEFDSGLSSFTNGIDDSRVTGEEETAESFKLPEKQSTVEQQEDKLNECANADVNITDGLSSERDGAGTEKCKDEKVEDSPVYARINLSRKRKTKVIDEPEIIPHAVTQDDGDTVDNHEESAALDDILAPRVTLEAKANEEVDLPV